MQSLNVTILIMKKLNLRKLFFISSITLTACLFLLYIFTSGLKPSLRFLSNGFLETDVSSFRIRDFKIKINLYQKPFHNSQVFLKSLIAPAD